MRKHALRTALAVAVLSCVPAISATAHPEMGYGPGMGYGGGMMGPGMMGYGGGMMGPGMMGPGMMGPGMMGYGGGMMGPGMMGWGSGQRIDLTPEQQKRIQQLQQQFQKENSKRFEQLNQAMQQYQQQLRQETPDPKSVGNAYEKLAQVQKELIQARVQAHNQIRGVFTEEQRQQLQGMGMGFGGMW